jgi:hypothetical protein
VQAIFTLAEQSPALRTICSSNELKSSASHAVPGDAGGWLGDRSSKVESGGKRFKTV